MNIYDRQERIKGWDQTRFSAASVAVYGQDWLAAYTVLGLSYLGVRRISWLRPAHAETTGFDRLLLAEPCPFSGARIDVYRITGEWESEIDWILCEPGISALLLAESESFLDAKCLSAALKRQIPVFAAGTRGGGFFGAGQAPAAPFCPLDHVVAPIMAGILVDAARVTICPLPNDVLPEEGRPGLLTPSELPRDGTIVLVGAGGIGVYAATVLAALGLRIHIEDFDTVAFTNLNRGLFSTSNARERTLKSEAAAAVLSNLFPQAHITAGASQVDVTYWQQLAKMQPPVCGILSAVDNAKSRKVLEQLGNRIGAPVVQGGTDTFAADVFTQDVDGPSLDQQMHGALSAAASRESGLRQPGGCAARPIYVVPGMIAGGLMAYRLIGLLLGRKRLPPARWRVGTLPVHTRIMNNVSTSVE
jgi:hypothetical protein